MTIKKYKILVLLAHPSLHHSNIHSFLRETICNIDNVTIHDLYDAYPEFYIDVKYEQQQLLKHDLIVFQHPLYWYSTTPMLKLWQDVVLSHGFAYGTEGTALKGKHFLQVISTGGKAEAYQFDGYNGFTIDELVAPMKATTRMCGMNFHNPFTLHHSYKVSKDDLDCHANLYRNKLLYFRDNGSFQHFTEET